MITVILPTEEFFQNLFGKLDKLKIQDISEIQTQFLRDKKEEFSETRVHYFGGHCGKLHFCHPG